ncbi:TetR family transcriptional regulator [Nocardioides flavescens]|uniref:TetR family transcriptional regulator n=1 Tax=Nocardioides flavescens TaxID=2691959 RepID=A0A6L7EYZ8_9ACTN|nr:TetR family transcriptional regulator [Nocardioides flavescens]
MTTPAGAETRRKLVETATRAFAEDGIERASLLDIARRAGQRNRGAVHYHFGSRTGILAVVLEGHVGFLHERHAALLETALATPYDGPQAPLGPVLEALIRPCVDLADRDWEGRCFLVIVAELIGADPASVDPTIREVMARTGGQAVYDELEERLPPLPHDLRVERLTLMTTFVLRAVADRAQSVEQPQGRPQLDADRFTANLVAMVAGMLTAPAP